MTDRQLPPADLPPPKPTYHDWVRAVNERQAPAPRKGNKRTGYVHP